jgi:acyl carrier protein
MGLDAVELVMEIEDTFGFQIHDAEAVPIRTVGELYSFVLGQLGLRASNVCLSSATFYRLRRALLSRSGVRRRWVKPSARTDALVPGLGRRAEWHRLASTLELSLPALRHPRWLVWLIRGFSGVTALCMVLLASLSAPSVANPVFLCVLITVGYVLALLAGLRLTRALASEVPPDCATIRGLVQRILRMDFRRVQEQVGSVNEREVWWVLRGIIVEMLGVAPERVTPQARLVEDLGMG